MGKHIHRLSDIDLAAWTATCAQCGEVGLYKSGDRWLCARGPRKTPPPSKPKRMPPPSEFHRLSEIDPDAKRARCSRCGPVAIIGGPSRRGQTGHNWACAEARRLQRAGREHGVTGAERDTMLAEQGGVCRICETDQPGGIGWCVDHDHETGAVRGVLCHACNSGLGYFRDSVENLASAIIYLLSAEEPLNSTRRMQQGTSYSLADYSALRSRQE